VGSQTLQVMVDIGQLPTRFSAERPGKHFREEGLPAV